MPNRVLILKEKFTNSVWLPFRDGRLEWANAFAHRRPQLLPESKIQEYLDVLNIKYRRSIFDPFIIIWAFLSQVLDPDKTCHNAVSRIISWLASQNAELPSQDTGGYCRGGFGLIVRQTASLACPIKPAPTKRLPEKLFSLLFNSVANSDEDKATEEHLWCDRHVKVIDGSTVSMPDTSENQEAYPQP